MKLNISHPSELIRAENSYLILTWSANVTDLRIWSSSFATTRHICFQFKTRSFDKFKSITPVLKPNSCEIFSQWKLDEMQNDSCNKTSKK